MANSADPDQPTDLDLHCLQRQDLSVFSRTGLRFMLSRSIKLVMVIHYEIWADIINKQEFILSINNHPLWGGRGGKGVYFFFLLS